MLQAFQGLALTTAKLHHVVVHVLDQLTCQGPGSLYTEFWIERMIWYLKLYLKDRVKDKGEVMFVKDHLLTNSARSCRCEFPDHCLTIDEREARRSPISFPKYDVTGDDVLLLGKAVANRLSDREMSCIVQQLPGLLRLESDSGAWYRNRGWPAIEDDLMVTMIQQRKFRFHKYLQASLPSMDVVTCNEDCRHVASDNRWVFVGYKYEDNTECPCVGQVQTFVRIQTSNGASTAFDPRGCVPLEDVAKYTIPSGTPGKSVPAEPLRMAICKLWAAKVCDCDAIGSPERQPGSVPDLLYVHNVAEGDEFRLPHSARGRRGAKCYYGEVLVNLPEVWSQLTPSDVDRNDTSSAGDRGSQYFMSCSKMSGK